MGAKEHERLLRILPTRPEDYRPWGDDDRDVGAASDCSSGCRWALRLADLPDARLGSDWCVCTNPRSHRCGLLTFEHQGCRAFEAEDDDVTG